MKECVQIAVTGQEIKRKQKIEDTASLSLYRTTVISFVQILNNFICTK